MRGWQRLLKLVSYTHILWCSGMNEVIVLKEGYVRITEAG